MSLTPGTRLGPYEIEASIGAGGMGEVYRAKDTRLDRTVAVKVLLDELSCRAGLRQRFEREARAIASLNHPHICALHDVGQQDGVDFLVMEYLEGETLADRLSHGALKTDLLLRYAIQIADALDKAHRQGFVHRDLKPGNIMLTRTGVKLLDFGLAKIVAGGKTPGGGIVGEMAATATMQPLTAEGTIAGTLQYMAPEQLEGKEADARTDIFAFGAVVYEMATGKKAFEGKSQASLIAAILGADPKPLRTLQPLTPPALERVTQTCLAKDPEERWQNAHDIMRELEWIAEAKGQPEETIQKGLQYRERLLWVAASAILLIGLLALLPFALGHLRQAPAETRVMKFSILPPEKASLGSFAVSPDGRWLAFTATTGGKDQLWVQALSGLTAQALPGTEGASYPFWSPDSRSIAFFANVKLKKIEVTGGPVQTVCDVTGTRSGGTWNRDGVILFVTSGFGLHQASATGGSAKLIMAHGQEQYISPFFLPDGYHFLEYIRSPRKETRGIYVASLDGTVKRHLLAIDSNAVYAPSLSGDRQMGYLLFLREGALLAQPFDTRQMKLTGEPLPIAGQVGRDAGYWNEVRGNFSVSDNGLLVYDSSVNRRSKQLVWVDRQGKLIRSLGAAGGYTPPCLSPDEKQVVVDRFNDQTGFYDLWLYDVEGGGASQFTFDPALNNYPVWSPDGRRIIWRSNREGQNNFYWKAASGTGQDELLLKSSNTNPMIPISWSLDGRFLIYYEIDLKTKRDIWVLPLSGDRKPFPFLQTEASEGAGQLSPDGRWMAYTSDESSAFEIYVRSFPSGGGQKLVSTGGGIGPYWRRDGKELFYYAPDGKLMAVEVKSDPRDGRQEASFEAGPPRVLFEFRSSPAVPNRPYAVTADGQRFLLNTIVDESGGAPLTVKVNWQAELKR